MKIFLKYREFLLLALPGAILGIIIIWAMQRWGVGITTDTLFYISVARSLEAGKGLLTITNAGTFEPLTHFPPLMSILLWLLSDNHLFSFQILAFISFFVLVIGLGAYVLFRTKSLTLMVIAQGLLLFSRDLLTVHSMGWSEPLFIVLFIVGAVLLAEYLRTQRISFVVFTAILWGISIVIRYSGLFLIPILFIVLLVSKKQQGNTWKESVLRTMPFAGIVGLPFLSWVAYLWLFVKDSSIREFHVYFMDIHRVIEGYMTFLQWFLPFSLPDSVAVLATLVGVLGTLVAIIMSFTYRAQIISFARKHQDISLWVGLCLAYILFIVATITFFDPITPMDFRIFSPLFPLAVLIVIQLLHTFKKYQWVGFILVVSVIINGMQLISYQFTNGTFLAGPEWQNSETIAAVKDLPKDAKVFSNALTAIYVLGERENSALPFKVTSLKTRNSRFPSEMEHLQKTYENQETYIVVFKPARSISTQHPTEKEIASMLSVSTVKVLRDGIIFKLEKQE
ncbi:MAG: hypothetical protein QY314_01805 [Candidatus Dojkabacteria bacterium]|nr:MAG: hypothetical protein QY314_01805 [Candidatus Dojkabacteria bacterium]